jgi:uncharacterized protein
MPSSLGAKKNMILAAFAANPHGTFTPVQIQKALFLIDRRIPDLIDGPLFNFRPYHYGPFDRVIYGLLEQLEHEGAVEIQYDCNFRRNSYRLTSSGKNRGDVALKNLPPEAAQFITEVARFVTALTFTQLISSIYRAYPEMKENSVFA